MRDASISRMTVVLDANILEGLRMWALAEGISLNALVGRELKIITKSETAKAHMKKGIAELQAKIDKLNEP